MAGIAIKYNCSLELLKRENGLYKDQDVFLRTWLNVPVAKRRNTEEVTTTESDSTTDKSLEEDGEKCSNSFHKGTNNHLDFFTNFDSHVQQLAKTAKRTIKEIKQQ